MSYLWENISYINTLSDRACVPWFLWDRFGTYNPPCSEQERSSSGKLIFSSSIDAYVFGACTLGTSSGRKLCLIDSRMYVLVAHETIILTTSTRANSKAKRQMYISLYIIYRSHIYCLTVGLILPLSLQLSFDSYTYAPAVPDDPKKRFRKAAEIN